MTRPLLAVSMGDPVGVGPEVVLKAASVRDLRRRADVVVVGDPEVMAQAARDALVDAVPVEVVDCDAARSVPPDQVAVLRASSLGAVAWAHPTAETDAAQGAYVERAHEVVASGAADAIVTAPISKAAMRRAGYRHTAHTELLAALSGGARSVMLLVGPSLKVVPVTTHMALAEVPGALTTEGILRAIEAAHDGLVMYFGQRRPRIAVAALNPHGGEAGLFGDEEARVIAPAVAEARRGGKDVSGPLPPDTLFQHAVQGAFDVVVGMYHDQVLIPLKLLDFDQAVNVTLGLPVIRTSVDHGTAYDIAGQGVASAQSMMAAIRLGATMARRRARHMRADQRARPVPTA